MDVLTKKVSRHDLSKVFTDHKTLVAFERLQDDATNSGDLLNNARFILTAPDANLSSSRVLTGSLNVTIADASGTATLDLSDTTVSPDTYGTTTRIGSFVVDRKGRLTHAENIKFDISDVDGLLAVAHGGTHIASYAVGDLLQASGTTTLAKLPAVATGNVLLSGGVGVVSTWGKVDLTAHVTGILPIANGGTGTSTAGYTGAIVVGAQTLHFVNGFLATVT